MSLICLQLGWATPDDWGPGGGGGGGRAKLV